MDGTQTSSQAMYSCVLLVPICLLTDYDLLTCPVLGRPTWFPDGTLTPTQTADACQKLLGPLSQSHHTPFAIALSCFFAVGVNLSTFLVVGKTSPATFAVVSQGKLICILTSGFLMFGDKVSAAAILGSSLAVMGVSWYSYCKAYNI